MFKQHKPSARDGQVVDTLIGPQVVIRWYEAHPPDSEKVPICAVARLSRDQMRKLPGSQPGVAILEGAKAAASIVDEFR